MTHKSTITILPTIAIVGLVVAIFGLTSSLLSLINRRTILTNRQEELKRLKNQNLTLQKQLQEVQTPEFIEKEAREKLNLSKAGETVILIDTGSNTQNQYETQHLIDSNQLPHWKKWWNLFF